MRRHQWISVHTAAAGDQVGCVADAVAAWNILAGAAIYINACVVAPVVAA